MSRDVAMSSDDKEQTPQPRGHEIGTLSYVSTRGYGFVGSSSGVFFIDTVKQVFDLSGSFIGEERFPRAEETVAGEDDLTASTADFQKLDTMFADLGGPAVSSQLLHRGFGIVPVPPLEKARLWSVEYFRVWHPILPFLSGPAFLRHFDDWYSGANITEGRNNELADRGCACRALMIRSVLALGAYLTDSTMPAPLHPSYILTLVAPLASGHDIVTIQTLLAAQLYCISCMSIRTASSLSGLIFKALLHAGLHRCPYRYPLPEDERCLRKRVFWSAYALDRYLNQALGLPLTITDDDIDVCVPGRQEMHQAVYDQTGARPRNEGGRLSSSVELKHVSNPQHRTVHTERQMGTQGTQWRALALIGADSNPAQEPDKRTIIFCSFVEYSKLISEVLELFHKSISVRNIEPSRVIFLKTKVDKWFNHLPDASGETPAAYLRHTRFFRTLYQQLVILINRPALSLPQSSQEFQHAIQVTITAAKNIIHDLHDEHTTFWPGRLALIWMAGLILAFACQIGAYDIDLGTSEINSCLDILKSMELRWTSVQRCRSALSILLERLTKTKQNEGESEREHTTRSSRPSNKRKRTPDTSKSSPDPAMNTLKPHAKISVEGERFGPRLGTLGAEVQPAPININFQSDVWDIDDMFQDLSWDSLWQSTGLPETDV